MFDIKRIGRNKHRDALQAVRHGLIGVLV